MEIQIKYNKSKSKESAGCKNSERRTNSSKAIACRKMGAGIIYNQEQNPGKKYQNPRIPT